MQKVTLIQIDWIMTSEPVDSERGEEWDVTDMTWHCQVRESNDTSYPSNSTLRAAGGPFPQSQSAYTWYNWYHWEIL